MEQQTEYTEIITNRIKFYRLLARLFKTEIDQPLFDQLGNMQLNVSTGNEELDAGYKLIGDFVQNPPLAALTELATDYVKIFIGAGSSENNGAAYPYESVYTSPERLLMQDARDQVLAAYRAKGLEPKDSYKAPEDHIALELEFMAHLCEETLQELAQNNTSQVEGCLTTQKEFLCEHLLKWVPEFCEDMQKFAQTDFYLGVAKITNSFLLMDRDLLNQNFS